MAKVKILKIANVDKDVVQQEFSCIAGGNAIWYNHSGSFLQVKHTLSI